MVQRGLSRFGRLGLPAGLGVAVALVVVVAGQSCTTFVGIEDVLPPKPDPTADAAADAAPDVDAGPVLPAYLSLTDAARVCSLAFRCPDLATTISFSSGIPIDPGNYSDCLTWLAGPIPATRVGFQLQQSMLQCMVKSATCTAAAACGSAEQIPAGDPRCAADAGDRCADNGATVLRCSASFALHCSTAYFGPGSACRKGKDNGLWCSSADTCNVSTSCLGSVLDYCGYENGVPTGLRFGINCPAVGNSCGLNTDAGVADCLTDGVTRNCTTVGASCAGSVVEVCNGSAISLFKCADLGATCSAAQGPAQCVRADAQCTPFDANVNKCSGAKLHVCVGGKPVDLDCASIGQTCKPSAGSVPAQCGS